MVMSSEYSYFEKGVDGIHTGERKPYMIVSEIKALQRILRDLRLTGGERKRTRNHNTMKETGLLIGILGENIFQSAFPQAIIQTAKPDHDFIVKVTSALFPAQTDKSTYDLKIDAKTRRYKNYTTKEGKEYKHPAHFFPCYVQNHIKMKWEKGLYETSAYAFLGVHEDEKTAYFFGILEPETFFRHAEWKDRFWDVSTWIDDSWWMEAGQIYDLSIHRDLGLFPNYDYENQNDEESFFIVRKGSPYEVQIFDNDELYGRKTGITTTDNPFSYSDGNYFLDNDSYKFRFYSKDKHDPNRKYHLIVERQYIDYVAGI